jgi:UDP-2,4-diacetamido-2,4,6-trideoxy-beta-L-altropyranose hydrolase
MRVAIRADGSPFIGLGHIVRSLALAAALRQAGHEVVFLSRFEPGLSRIREQGFAAREVVGGVTDGPGKEYEPAGDGPAVARLLATEKFDALVTDSYRVDTGYFLQVRPLVTASFYMDDLNRFPVAVDGVINGNINAAELGYHSWPASVKLWLGCQYNLLRQQFAALPDRITAQEVRTLLIIAGGGDSGKVVEFLARSLLDNKATGNLALRLVVPARSVAGEELERLPGRYPERIRLYRDVTEMADLMRECDLAISAGGTTLYELCAAGLPRLAVVLADNQQSIVDAMARQELVVSLGAATDLTAAAVAESVALLAGDRAKRDRQNRQGRKLVDGQGARRAGQRIEQFVAAAGGGQASE